MPYHSPYPPLDIPRDNVLSHLFPENVTLSDKPLWLDAANPSNSLSAKQMFQWAKRLGIGLDRVGVKENEVALVFTPNHIFVPCAYLGIVGAKRVFSGANPTYTVAELAHQIKTTGTKLVLAYPDLVETAIKAVHTVAKETNGDPAQIFLFSDTYLPPRRGVHDWRTFIGSPQEADQARIPKMTAQESEETVATVNFSSGTTGLPKGVSITHFNLIANLEQNLYMRYVGRGYNIDNAPPERWLSFLPLYHAYGQLYANMGVVRLGVPCYIMKAFNFEKYLQHIQDYRITNLQVAPPIIIMLAKRPETAKYDLSSVTDMLTGAAPLPVETAREVSRRFGIQINSGWGMTEVTCGGLLVPGGTIEETGSIGHILPNTSVALLSDAGDEVPHGHRGELHIRGPQIMKEYWRNAAATRDTLLPGGWLRTGDMAVMRNGLFWIVDRKKELIKVNALQVAPAELEAVLLENDAVADAAVTGITLHGEEFPRAYIALAEAAKGKVRNEDIHKWFDERVAKHKRLAGGIMFVDEVPKLASGKIMRKVMREWAARDAKAMEAQPKAKL